MADDDPTRRLDSDVFPTVRGLRAGQTVFERYLLETTLGAGGMGVVWRARDTELDELVALKFLPDAVANDAAALDELKDETRRALRLTHPNIVRIRNFEREGDMAAVSMEFVDGMTLSQLRLSQPGKVFAIEALAPLVAQLCAALDYAHGQARIVHRDLKPANVLVTRDGVVKVTDFGIARSLTESSTRITGKGGDTSGTIPYMSPQQLRGRKPKAADDIYALGVTLYELLTSKPPFFRGDPNSLRMQILEEAPLTPLMQRDELEVTGGPILPAWDAVIMACLAKEPEDRPQSAGEVARRLGLSGSAGSDSGRAGADVFISYSKPDRIVAEAVCGILEARGVRCWIAPRDIVPGKDWSECIINALNRCPVMVLVFSSHANGSPQVRREVQRAFEKNMTVIPFRVEDVVPVESLEYYIGSVHWLDALTPPLEPHLQQLVVTVKGLLDGRAAARAGVDFPTPGAVHESPARAAVFKAAPSGPAGPSALAAGSHGARIEPAVVAPAVPRPREEPIQSNPAREPENQPQLAGEVARQPGPTEDSADDRKTVSATGQEAAGRSAAISRNPEPFDSAQGHPEPARGLADPEPVEREPVEPVELEPVDVQPALPEKNDDGHGQKDRAADALPAQATKLKDRREIALHVLFLALAFVLAGGWYFGWYLPSERQIEAAKAAEAYHLANAKGGLIVRTDPAGAEVRVGGFALEHGPLVTLKDVKIGEYPVAVSAPGYDDFRTDVEVKENDFAELSATLVRSRGWLTLTTDPAGLGYRLEGGDYRTEGQATTMPIGLPTGNYTLTVTRDGYPEVRRAVGIQRGETSKEDVALKGASIALNSTPSGAEVWQDGRLVGHTMYVIPEVVPGSYAFEFKLKGYQSAARKLTVTVGQSVQETVALTGEPISLPDLGITMQPIPAGTFTMGSPEDEPGRRSDEGPQTKVTITRSFWLEKTEVTHGQWKAVMGTDLVEQVRKALADDTLYEWGDGKKMTLRDFWKKKRDDDPTKLLVNTGDAVPMTYVSWEDAMEFCRKLTERERARGRLPDGYAYTLPTEAQWEYSCRAGTTDATYAGPMQILGERNAPVLDGIAWYGGNSSVGYNGVGYGTEDWKEKQYPGGRAGPREVATKQANAWGLHDMLGNLFEWCRDYYGIYTITIKARLIMIEELGDRYGNHPAGSATDPTGPLSGAGRVCRGGSFFDNARACRSADRDWLEPGQRSFKLGFRIALAPSP